MSDLVNLGDFVAGFLIEAEEHLHSVNANLVATSEALEAGRPEPRAIRDLFRSLHTIKGLAAMVGAEPIVDIAHEMETLLRVADRSGGKVSEHILDLLVQGTRVIEERVRNVRDVGVKSIPAVPPKLIEALALALNEVGAARDEKEFDLSLPPELLATLSAADREQIIQAPKTNRRAVLIEFQPSAVRAEQGLNITTLRERLAKIGDLIKVIPRSSPQAPTGIAFFVLFVTDAPADTLTQAIGDAQARSISAEQTATPETPLLAIPEMDVVPEWLPTEQSSIRVDVRRLDEALEQLSGLFVTRFKLERAATAMAANGADTRELKSVINENARQLRRLRSAISEARMVPLAELLQRLPLVVRGLTKDSAKTVNVRIHAGSAEVDKAVADKIFPAVVHLVRNAVDHAIESREERKRAMKPEAGELSIICDDSSGTNLILTISDDGRGIDRTAVARKAGKSPAKSDEELLAQICTAGLSTSATLTHTSGRGMGMDIVKRTIEILGGAFSLHTVEGKGTSITLRVPVTVTIVDVLSFVSGDQSFVAPVAIVDEIIEIDEKLAAKLPSTGATGPQPRLIQYRGKTIPLYVLSSLLHASDYETFPPKALIVQRGGKPIAFGIDRMIGKQEAVVRPLDDSLVRANGMAGATDLGDGKPTLVLDLAVLGAYAMQTEKEIGHE